jgi:Lyase
LADNSSPTIKDIPIGVEASGERREFDSMGEVRVPADRYWGAQTQRSLQHFSIGDDRMPKAVYHAYGYVKKACALVNHEAGRLPPWKKEAIVRAAKGKCRRFAIGVTRVPTTRQAMSAPSGALAPQSSATHREA